MNEYQPDVVSPPGDTLKEIMLERGLTPQIVAVWGRCMEKAVTAIIDGKKINRGMALNLERALGIPALFWLNRERQYREYLKRGKVMKFWEPGTRTVTCRLRSSRNGT